MNSLLLAFILAALPANQGFKQCDSVINEAINQEITPGAVLYVTKGNKIVYHKAYGMKSYLPTEEKMTEETIFDLASLSKCLGTTLCVMKLIEDGKIGLDDKVSKYIPDFQPWKGRKGKKVDITIKHLLSHTSGLSAGVNMKVFMELHGANQPDSLMHFIAQLQPRLFKPGTNWKYSCPNFIILGYIVELVSGERLCDFAAHNFYEPLGLKSTSYLPLDRPIPENFIGRIAPTELLRDGTLLCGQVHDPPARIVNNGNSGNAGLFSDAEDISVLCRMILGGGKYRKVRVLKEETIDLMLSVPYPAFGRTLGWDSYSTHAGIRGELPKERCVCHTGYTGTSIVMDRENDIAIILLCNRVHPIDTEALGKTRTALSDIIWETLL